MSRFAIIAVLFTLMSVGALAQRLQVVYINNQPMMALQDFGATFNVTIDYDKRLDAISLSQGGRVVDFIPYANIAWIDGHVVKLDTPVVIVDDVTYLPVNFVCDTFGYNCLDQDGQFIIVNQVTLVQTVWVIDSGWGQRHHHWQRHFHCRGYRHFHVPRLPAARPSANHGRLAPAPRPVIHNNNHTNLFSQLFSSLNRHTNKPHTNKPHTSKPKQIHEKK